MYAQREFWLLGTPYHVLTVDGITEVVRLRPYEDHQNMVQNDHIVALLYLVDDPAIKKEVLEAQARYIKEKENQEEKPVPHN